MLNEMKPYFEICSRDFPTAPSSGLSTTKSACLRWAITDGSTLHTQRLLVISLLGCGIFGTSLLSYYALRESIRNLPITADTVYSEIQKDLMRPILISSMMALNTFVHDWVVEGEHAPEQMIRYLNEIMVHYDTSTAFFISSCTMTYYHGKGGQKSISSSDPWYLRVRDAAEPYDINVDHDNLTLFINHKVFNYRNNLIGVTGIGLTVDWLVKLIDQYQQRYQRRVQFIDTSGRIVLPGNNDDARQPMHCLESLQNLRFVSELNWYLFVDKYENDVLGEICKSLSMCLGISLTVLVLLNYIISRYQRKIEALAALDSLTGLPNRRGFGLLAAQAMQETKREFQPLSVLLLDLDHFKCLNDTYGHFAADRVLARFARDLRGCLRQSDIVCRWGGEEFIVLLKNTRDGGALRIAEKICKFIEGQSYTHEGRAMRTTVSIGLASLQTDDTLYNLLNRADQAMYGAKQAGRNRVCAQIS